MNHGPAAIHTNDNKIGKYDDKDNDIILVANIPHGNAPPQNLIAIPDSNKDVASTNGDSDSYNVNSDNDDDNGPDFQDAHHHDEEQNDEEQGDEDAPGVRCSRRNNCGQTTRYTNFGLMMATRRMAQGGQRRAIIRDGICYFLAEDLHGAKPIPEEDCKEYALGVALAQYSIGAGIKKFQERGEDGVSKELTQMHNMQVF